MSFDLGCDVGLLGVILILPLPFFFAGSFTMSWWRLSCFVRFQVVFAFDPRGRSLVVVGFSWAVLG